MITALVLAATIGISVDLDLTPLLQRHEDAARVRRTLVCGRKVNGYEIHGNPEDVVTLKRRKYQIGRERVMLLIAEPHDALYSRGRQLEIGEERDAFGFVMVEVGEATRSR